mmetsp:Transcript_82915/g.267309  ORF Transcript_82915/g.267309 Transcript_82915/m.267309 type:complete len:210 (+) Transcript_82915:145-774(+)
MTHSMACPVSCTTQPRATMKIMVRRYDQGVMSTLARGSSAIALLSRSCCSFSSCSTVLGGATRYMTCWKAEGNHAGESQEPLLLKRRPPASFAWWCALVIAGFATEYMRKHKATCMRMMKAAMPRAMSIIVWFTVCPYIMPRAMEVTNGPPISTGKAPPCSGSTSMRNMIQTPAVRPAAPRFEHQIMPNSQMLCRVIQYEKAMMRCIMP